MALSPNSAITPQKVKSATAIVPLAAVTGYNGATPVNTVALVVPAGFDGGRLTKLVVKPRDTTVAGRILLFKSPNNGTGQYLVDAKDVTAYTWSATAGPTAANTADFGFTEAVSSLFGGNGSSVTETWHVGCSTTQTGGGFLAYAEWLEY